MGTNTLLPISHISELKKYSTIREADPIRDKDFSPAHDAIMHAICERLQEYGTPEIFSSLWSSSMFPERLTKQILRIIEQM